MGLEIGEVSPSFPEGNLNQDRPVVTRKIIIWGDKVYEARSVFISKIEEREIKSIENLHRMSKTDHR
jgi:hypothetical protein